MKRREKRTQEEIVESVIKAIKTNGPLTREEIDFHCDYPRTSENHLPKIRKAGFVHIAKWEIRSVPGRYEALFDVGRQPDLPKPSEPGRRVIFFDESEARADIKYKKQYRPQPQRVNVPWLGAV